MSHKRSSSPNGVAAVVTLVLVSCTYALELPTGKDPASPASVLVTSIAGVNFVMNAVATIFIRVDAMHLHTIHEFDDNVSAFSQRCTLTLGKCSTAALTTTQLHAHVTSWFIPGRLCSSISSSVSDSATYLTMLGLSFRMQGHPAEGIGAVPPTCAAGLFQIWTTTPLRLCRVRTAPALPPHRHTASDAHGGTQDPAL